MTPNQVLYEVSYTNIVMYGSAVPLFDDVKDDVPDFDERLDANDPANYEEDLDEQVVRS